MIVRKIPVSFNLLNIWVVSTEYRIVYPGYISGILILLPVCNNLRSGNDSLQRLLGNIAYSVFFCSCMFGIYIFPVDTRCNYNFVAWLCDVRSILNSLERSFLASVTATCGINVDIDLHRCTLLFALMLTFVLKSIRCITPLYAS